MSRARVEVLRRSEPLKLGFLPVADCAPLVYAAEAGLFGKYGLDVELKRERSWTTLRDRVIYGELDAAHAPATLPFLANLGLESDPCACVSGLVLSLQGNAVTISRQLWDQGVRDAATLREQIYKHWGKHVFTFGVVFSFSSQEILLRRWLRSAGIPDARVRIVAVPPSQMFPTLKLGYMDGYCVGEPWASMAVQAGVGMQVATSAELAPLHPEKVLMVRQSFAIGRADEHERLLASLLQACAYCDAPEHREELSLLLAQPEYVNAPADCIRPGLPAPPATSVGAATAASGQAVFHRHSANEPTDEKAEWLIENLYELVQDNIFRNRNLNYTPVLKNIFRRDIFQRAQAAVQEHNDSRRVTPLVPDATLSPCG
jgi:two-component system, oxyanion-binding sensor